MTDETEEAAGWEPHVILGNDGGECYFADLRVLLDDYAALAVKFEGGELYLFQASTHKWAALSTLKPKDKPGHLRPIR